MFAQVLPVDRLAAGTKKLYYNKPAAGERGHEE